MRIPGDQQLLHLHDVMHCAAAATWLDDCVRNCMKRQVFSVQVLHYCGTEDIMIETWHETDPDNEFCDILHQPVRKFAPIAFPHSVRNISCLSVICNWLKRFTEQFSLLINNSFPPPAPESWISSTCVLFRSHDLSRSTEMNYKPIFPASFELPAWRLVSIKMNESIWRKWILYFCPCHAVHTLCCPYINIHLHPIKKSALPLRRCRELKQICWTNYKKKKKNILNTRSDSNQSLRLRNHISHKVNRQ